MTSSNTNVSRLAERDGFRLITPELAAEWLATRSRPFNRPVNARTVARYAKAMRERRWAKTGQPIIFDTEGFLHDGQHRLNACVQSGVPFVSYVVFEGVDPMSFVYLDTGRIRSASDALGILGEINTIRLAASAKLVYWYESGSKGASASMDFDNTLALGVIAKHPTLRESVATTSRFKGVNAILPASIMGFVHYMAARTHPIKIDSFMELLATGVGLASDSPILALRNRLISNKMAKAKLPQHHILALTIKAWLAYNHDKPMRTLRWIEGESFPHF